MILTKPFNVNLSYTEGIKSFATFLFVLFSRLLLVTMMNRQHGGKYIFSSDVILSRAVHTLDFITLVFAYIYIRIRGMHYYSQKGSYQFSY